MDETTTTTPPWEELPPELWAMVFREVTYVGSANKLRDILGFVCKSWKSIMEAEREGTAPICRGSFSLSDAVYEMSPGAMNWVLEFPEARRGLLETYGGDSGIPMVGSLLLRLVDADRADVLEELCRYTYISPRYSVCLCVYCKKFDVWWLGGNEDEICRWEPEDGDPEVTPLDLYARAIHRGSLNVVRWYFEQVRSTCPRLSEALSMFSELMDAQGMAERLGHTHIVKWADERMWLEDSSPEYPDY
ncbi:hypothetical protein QOT17_019169 [Balamuthia mandrillaris]